jgi:hypothetical protein
VLLFSSSFLGTIVSNLSRRTAMRELTDLELDAVSGGFTIVKGNGGVAVNNRVHQHVDQDAEVEQAHDVTQVQAASQSNSISVSFTKS